MKRSVWTLLMCILLVCLISVNTFAVSDQTPPEIQSISINSTSLYGGGELMFNVSASDDTSGVGHIMIEYRLQSNYDKRITIEFDNTSTTNNFTGSYILPEKVHPGLWEVSAIQIWDNAGNLQVYLSESLQTLGNINFTVMESPGVDIVPPVLNSIKVKNMTISAPGKIEVVAVATDDKSSNLKIQVTYSISNSQHGFQLLKTTGNTYEGSLAVEENAKYQKVKLDFVIVEDDAGNQTWNSYSPGDYPFGDQSLRLDTNLDVSFSNFVSDTTPPELLGFTYSSSQVEAPGTVNISFDVKDDSSGIASIKPHFAGYDENGNVIDYWLLSPQHTSNTTYVSNFTFDQYYPNATFFYQ